MKTFNDIQEKGESITDFKCTTCGIKFYIDELLSKYGPEGLYELADQLKAAADEDVSDSMK